MGTPTWRLTWHPAVRTGIAEELLSSGSRESHSECHSAVRTSLPAQGHAERAGPQLARRSWHAPRAGDATGARRSSASRQTGLAGNGCALGAACRSFGQAASARELQERAILLLADVRTCGWGLLAVWLAVGASRVMHSQQERGGRPPESGTVTVLTSAPLVHDRSG